jgi:hypothetical protein
MARFEVVDSSDAIRLEWETASEIEILGFNLYRAESGAGPEARVNDALVPSQSPGSPLGAAYSFVDSTVAPGIAYYYWLEVLDVSGNSTRYGPLSTATPAKMLHRAFLPIVCHEPAGGEGSQE